MSDVGSAVAQQIPTTLRVVALVLVVLAVACLGRLVAGWLRQPQVIGEIVGGLLAGSLVFSLAGDAAGDQLRVIGHIGLVLFLVGIIYELRTSRLANAVHGVGSVAVWSFLPALLAGAAFAFWIVSGGGQAVRGEASTAAFVLFVAVAFTVTAVPVLARIIEDRGIGGTVVAQLAIASAVAIDTVAWLLLTVAIVLNAGGWSASLTVAVALVGFVVAALLLHRLFQIEPLAGWAGRHPRVTAVLIGVASVASARLASGIGLTELVGALAVGLAVPIGDRYRGWAGAVHRSAQVGRWLVPVFFVAAGATMLSGPSAALPVLICGVAVVIAIVTKIGGGYLGARLAGHPRQLSLRLGILMNTRGLTEIAMLQAGLAAGLIPAPLFVALILMALITTAVTGPLLDLVERRRAGSLRSRDLLGGKVSP